jgi:probable rRNA maturation factor
MMNKVEVNTQDLPLPSWSGSMRSFAMKVLEQIKRDKWELSILLCTDKTIKELNSQYRNINEPTDILSFRFNEEIKKIGKTVYLPGDIVISLDTLRENAKYFKTQEDEELRRIIIHGILHLDGMDHDTTSSKEPMLLFQEEILSRLNCEHILSGGEKI